MQEGASEVRSGLGEGARDFNVAGVLADGVHCLGIAAGGGFREGNGVEGDGFAWAGGWGGSGRRGGGGFEFTGGAKGARAAENAVEVDIGGLESGVGYFGVGQVKGEAFIGRVVAKPVEGFSGIGTEALLGGGVRRYSGAVGGDEGGWLGEEA